MRGERERKYTWKERKIERVCVNERERKQDKERKKERKKETDRQTDKQTDRERNI